MKKIDKPWSFDFREPDEKQKKELAEQLKNGIPSNMLVMRMQLDGRMKVVTDDTG